MINDYDDIFTMEVATYTGRSGKTITFKQSNEVRKMKERLLTVRKLSQDLVDVLINNSKSENWPEFIKKKNKEQIKKLKCMYYSFLVFYAVYKIFKNRFFCLFSW